MSRIISNPKDFWSGVTSIGMGLAAVVIGRAYSMGTTGRMGPGYSPVVLGAILTVIRVVAVVRSMFTLGQPISSFSLKNPGVILGATVLFGLLVRTAG